MEAADLEREGDRAMKGDRKKKRNRKGCKKQVTERLQNNKETKGQTASQGGKGQ